MEMVCTGSWAPSHGAAEVSEPIRVEYWERIMSARRSALMSAWEWAGSRRSGLIPERRLLEKE